MSKKAGKKTISRKKQVSSSGVREERAPSIENESVNPLPLLSGEESQAEVAEDLRPQRRIPPRGNPELAGGDVDAAWDRGDEGEETVGGSHATPDQDVVEELGRAVGVTYDENEPLRLGEKEEERDRQRWELDPASSEDYEEHVTPRKTKGEP
jgi:hypothetical protein